MVFARDWLTGPEWAIVPVYYHRYRVRALHSVQMVPLRVSMLSIDSFFGFGCLWKRFIIFYTRIDLVISVCYTSGSGTTTSFSPFLMGG